MKIAETEVVYKTNGVLEHNGMLQKMPILGQRQHLVIQLMRMYAQPMKPHQLLLS